MITRGGIRPGLAFTVAYVLWFVASAAGQGAKTTPPASGFVTTPDGIKIHYIEAGKGPAILFVPGWIMPGWIWEKQIAHFAKTHRVVAMDPRSTGESSQTAEGLYPRRTGARHQSGRGPAPARARGSGGLVDGSDGAGRLRGSIRHRYTGGVGVRGRLGRDRQRSEYYPVAMGPRLSERRAQVDRGVRLFELF